MTSDNDPSNPFHLNLNEVKPANESASVPSRAEPPAQQQPEVSFHPEQPQQVEPPHPFEPPAPQPTWQFHPEPPVQPSPAPVQSAPQPSPQSQVREYRHDPEVVREMVIPGDGSQGQRWLAFVIAVPVLAGLLGYAYWSTLSDLLETWKNNIDYHHGFFVAPFVAYFLWVRRDTFPKKQGMIDAALGVFLGLALLLFWSVFRYYVMVTSMVTLDSWTILVWIWAVCLMCFGVRVFIWALPSLLFLAFMFPWPHRVEMQMREPLQQFAAALSVYILRLVGEPAVAQANTVLMSNNQQLDVAAACSGIRVLVSVIAAAYATALLMRRPWWQNLLLFCLIVPVALFVNALRIAMTGLLIKNASEQVESFGFTNPKLSTCSEACLISRPVMAIRNALTKSAIGTIKQNNSRFCHQGRRINNAVA